MSIIGMFFMWVFFAIALAILNYWPMGKEIDRRQAYWARFEGK